MAKILSQPDHCYGCLRKVIFPDDPVERCAVTTFKITPITIALCKKAEWKMTRWQTKIKPHKPRGKK